MHPVLPALVGLSALVVISGDVFAGDDRTPAATVSNETVSGMAQRFLEEHYARAGSQRPRLSFDSTEVYPGEGRTSWAVVGGYMAFASGKPPEPHAFGLSMRLTCARHDDPDCWRLEKLLIDQKVILNN